MIILGRFSENVVHMTQSWEFSYWFIFVEKENHPYIVVYSLVKRVYVIVSSLVSWT